MTKTRMDLEIELREKGPSVFAEAVKNGDIVGGMTREGRFSANMVLHAIFADEPKAVEILLAAGTSPKVRHDALLWNAKFSSPSAKTLKPLMTAGISPKILNEAFDLLTLRKNASADFARVLIEDGVDNKLKPKAIQTAIQSGNTDLLEVLCDDADQNNRGASLQPVFRAAVKGVKIKDLDAGIVSVLGQRGFWGAAPF